MAMRLRLSMLICLAATTVTATSPIPHRSRWSSEDLTQPQLEALLDKQHARAVAGTDDAWRSFAVSTHPAATQVLLKQLGTSGPDWRRALALEALSTDTEPSLHAFWQKLTTQDLPVDQGRCVVRGLLRTATNGQAEAKALLDRSPAWAQAVFTSGSELDDYQDDAKTRRLDLPPEAVMAVALDVKRPPAVRAAAMLAGRWSEADRRHLARTATKESDPLVRAAGASLSSRLPPAELADAAAHCPTDESCKWTMSTIWLVAGEDDHYYGNTDPPTPWCPMCATFAAALKSPDAGVWRRPLYLLLAARELERLGKFAEAEKVLAAAMVLANKDAEGPPSMYGDLRPELSLRLALDTSYQGRRADADAWLAKYKSGPWPLSLSRDLPVHLDTDGSEEEVLASVRADIDGPLHTTVSGDHRKLKVTVTNVSNKPVTFGIGGAAPDPCWAYRGYEEVASLNSESSSRELMLAPGKAYSWPVPLEAKAAKLSGRYDVVFDATVNGKKRRMRGVGVVP